MSNIIKTVDICKRFGQHTAVDSLNIEIEQGTSHALLGPNGAGKTTTLKMLSSLLAPTSGQVFIHGVPMSRTNKDVKREMGMVSQHFSLQREMTPVEVLRFHGMLQKMKAKAIRDRTEQLLHFAGMEKDAGKLVNNLSGGNKRKLMIIRAVMHEPKLLFLDEPTVGLDAAIRRTIWDLLKRLKSGGMTTVFTTHYIEEAANLCDKVSMMCEGKVVAQDTPRGLTSLIEPYAAELFDGEQTSYHYFPTRDEAYGYAENRTESALIRKTDLEDVYVVLTNKRINK